LSLAAANLGANLLAGTDFLSQSRSAKMLCANPDADSKTCSSIASYKISADGSVTGTTEVLLAPYEPITLTMSMKGEFTGRSACGVLTLEALGRGVIRENGEPVPPKRNALMLKKLETVLRPVLGRKACDTIRIENDALVKYGKVEGVDIELPVKPIIWVSKSDGYRVAPR
jgi:hypothetical protein